MQTILIATDFSTHAEHAALYGYRLASQLGSEVTLAHAVIIPAEIPQTGLAGWPALPYDQLLEDGEKQLTRLKTKLEALPLITAARPPIHCRQQNCALTQMLSEQKADLIVMGTHGNDRLGTLLIGDHCRKAITALDKSLLFVPPAHYREQVRRLIFASDFSDPAADLNALRQLVSIARPLGAAVIIVHLYDGRTHTAQFGQMAAQMLEELAARTGYEQLTAETMDQLDVEQGLAAAVKSLHADMLILRHESHGWIHELLLSDHSKKMAALLHVPLLVLRAQPSPHHTNSLR